MADSLQELARNQMLFREVNERLRELAEVSATEFLCECGRTDCIETIALAREEHEAIRSFPTFFVIAPGHQTAGERIIEENERFALVENRNGVHRLTARSDDLVASPEKRVRPDASR